MGDKTRLCGLLPNYLGHLLLHLTRFLRAMHMQSKRIARVCYILVSVPVLYGNNKCDKEEEEEKEERHILAVLASL